MPPLSRLTWTDLDGARDRLLVVPVGATEQHGPHLPATTDTDIAEALVEALDRAREDVVVAPAVAFGSSGEHQGFPGTLSIGETATKLVLVELGRSATKTFGRVLFVSTHGGNAVPVAAAATLLRREGRDVRTWSPRWHGDAHAGHVETSVMLALHPDRVRSAAAQRGATAPIGALLPQLRQVGVRAVSDNGILGDATTATPEAGRTFLRRASADLHDAVAAWGTEVRPAERAVPARTGV